MARGKCVRECEVRLPSQHIQRIDIDGQRHSSRRFDGRYNTAQHLVQRGGVGRLELEMEAKEILEAEHRRLGGTKQANFLARVLEPFESTAEGSGQAVGKLPRRLLFFAFDN